MEEIPASSQSCGYVDRVKRSPEILSCLGAGVCKEFKLDTTNVLPLKNITASVVTLRSFATAAKQQHAHLQSECQRRRLGSQIPGNRLVCRVSGGGAKVVNIKMTPCPCKHHGLNAGARTAMSDGTQVQGGRGHSSVTQSVNYQESDLQKQPKCKEPSSPGVRPMEQETRVTSIVKRL